MDTLNTFTVYLLIKHSVTFCLQRDQTITNRVLFMPAYLRSHRRHPWAQDLHRIFWPCTCCWSLIIVSYHGSSWNLSQNYKAIIKSAQGVNVETRSPSRKCWCLFEQKKEKGSYLEKNNVKKDRCVPKEGQTQYYHTYHNKYFLKSQWKFLKQKF